MSGNVAPKAPACGKTAFGSALAGPDRHAWLWLFLITAGAFCLRLFRLTSQGLNMDEGFSALLGRIPWTSFVSRVWDSEFNMVLYYAVLRLWMHIGRGEFVVRLLSVLLATATVPVVYLLGKRLFDSRTGLIAALLLALHPFHLMLAQRARAYPLAVLLISLACLFFLRGLEKPTWGNWLAYAVLSAAAVYAHFFAVLVIGAQWMSLRFLPERPSLWKRMLGSTLLIVVMLAPVGVFLAQHPKAGNLDWVAGLNRPQLLSTLYAMTLTKNRSLAYLAMWAITVWCAFRLKPRARAWPYRFTLTWLLAPPLLVIGASLVRPMLVERFLAICIPAAVLAAAAGVMQLARWSKAAGVLVLVLIVFYSMSNVRYHLRHPEYGENWREASQYVFAHAEAGDEVVILPGMPRFVFDYYREMNPANVPVLVFANSAPELLPQPLPQNVWFVGWTERQSRWDTEAAKFLEAQRPRYCEKPLRFDASIVKVWQFRLCGAQPAMPSP